MKLRIAVCALLVACGSNTTPSNTTSSGSSNSDSGEVSFSQKPATCDQRVAALRAGSVREPQTTVAVPQAERWRPFVRRGVVAQVTRRNVVFDGEEISWVELDRLGKLLSKAGKREATKQSEVATPLYIVAEGAVAASRLNEILKATPGTFMPRLVVRRSKPAGPLDVAVRPLGSGQWFAGWLKKAQALNTEAATADSLRKEEIKSELTHLMRTGTKKAIGTKCAELRTVYEDAAKSKPEERGAFLAKGIPDALSACKCKGVDRAYDVLLEVMGGRPHTMGWLPLPKSISDPGSVKNIATIISARQPAANTK